LLLSTVLVAALLYSSNGRWAVAQNSTKDEANNSQLYILGIPIQIVAAVIGISATGAAFLWSTIQSYQKSYFFKRLIHRELEELTPEPRKRKLMGKWYEHQKRNFVHKDVFSDPKQNLQFTLTLNRDLVYHVTQLWKPIKKGNENSKEWLFHLYKLAKILNDKEDLLKKWVEWTQLITEYKYRNYKADSRDLTDLFRFWLDLRYDINPKTSIVDINHYDEKLSEFKTIMNLQ
jgi:hypothetical protein